jgi:hypothetical protein
MSMPLADARVEQSLQELILSARKTGFAEAVAEVTNLLVTIGHMDNAHEVFIALAKGIDAISRKGPRNA